MKKTTAAAFLSVLLMICLFILPQPVMAAYDSGYVITDYKMEITIGADNIYRITQTVTVNYNEYSHGIYLSIPYIYQIDWGETGGRPVMEKADIKDVSVKGDKYSAGPEGNDYVIKIGNPYATIIGEKTYVISYSQAFGKDKLSTNDLVYYTLVSKPDTYVENVSFTIHMPKEFDPSRLRFYAGYPGQSGDEPVDYTINGNTISGMLTRKLAPGEALTIHLDLPEGYFEPPEEFDWNGFLKNLVIGLDAAVLLLFLMFRLNRGVSARSDEYSPPGSLSPAEAGYLIENTINDGDVISLILYWASKGYLTIEQIDEGDFRITRLQNLSSEHKDYEVYMFNELFPNSGPVTLSQLQTKFYVVISDTKELIKQYHSKKENRYYNPISIVLGKIFSFIPGILIFASLLLGVYENTFALFIASVISVFCTAVILLPLVLLMKTIRRWNRHFTAASRMRLIISIALSVVLLGGYAYAMHYFRLTELGLLVSGSALFISIISALMRRRTKLGNELMGKMLGLKKFMESSDKPSLEVIAAKSPYLFYNLMPYAFVFGMPNLWMRKFRGISIINPQWYVGSYLGGMLVSPFILHRSLSNLRAPVAKNPAVTVTEVTGIPKGRGTGGGGSAGGGYSSGSIRRW